jgi:hypothetical protein
LIFAGVLSSLLLVLLVVETPLSHFAAVDVAAPFDLLDFARTDSRRNLRQVMGMDSERSLLEIQVDVVVHRFETAVGWLV